LNALVDSDVLLDFLDGYGPAGPELARYRERCISIITWIEVMAERELQLTKIHAADFLITFASSP
jgi:hypothetical protein